MKIKSIEKFESTIKYLNEVFSFQIKRNCSRILKKFVFLFISLLEDYITFNAVTTKQIDEFIYFTI